MTSDSKNPYETSNVENGGAASGAGVKFKLSLMMFLEFFIWGAWLPASFYYFGKGALNFTQLEANMLELAFPVAAVLGLFAGPIVDRTFAAERFLAFSHFVGGLAMLGFGALSYQAFATADAKRPEFWMFFVCMAVHCFFYVATISVTNSIAFANVKDAQKDFGPIRLWGTIGWIAASWPFIFILVDWAKVNAAKTNGFVDWLGLALATGLEGAPKNQGLAWAFIASGVASLALAAFSLTLPHTPPRPAKEGETLALGQALSHLVSTPFLLVLYVVTLIDATVHDGYFFFAFEYLGKVGVPSNWIQPAMSVGQIAEIGTMAVLAYFLKNLGWRNTMIIGILGHAVRFAVFAFVPNPYCAVAVNVLHGVCYAFFFATMYIMIDEFFPKDVRTSAQVLFNLLVLGGGAILSRVVWRSLKTAYTKGDTIEYGTLLLYPAAAAGVAALLLMLFFWPPSTATPEKVGAPAAH